MNHPGIAEDSAVSRVSRREAGLLIPSRPQPNDAFSLIQCSVRDRPRARGSSPAIDSAAGFSLPPLKNGVNARRFLRRPEVTYDVIAGLVPPPEPLSAEVIEQVTVETKFEGYLAKQQGQIERMKRLETRTIPFDFNYSAVSGLRLEAREKLIRFQPSTVGQASRIAGVNPADISILLVHLERERQGAGAQGHRGVGETG